ncbi:MAG: bacteriohemerythrin [Candidatus Thiodiazotropha sp. (ex Epidulcina cf. delphinae)]|nr:bacteriohemerythrin [Candidatus Thiodiazotropha sp. (ex Epidulcina cf. delphinae)]
MRKSLQTFGLSLFIVLAFLVIGIGFLFGMDNPVPWIMIAVLAVLPIIHKKITSRRFVSWDDSLGVGIQAIDDDHQKLLSLINNLQTAVLYPTGESFERQALNELVEYTKHHFQREEQLMQENGYPEYELHKREHKEMIEKVSVFLASYEKDREGAIDDLTAFLKTWLTDHIADTDRKYSKFLRDKGVR